MMTRTETFEDVYKIRVLICQIPGEVPDMWQVTQRVPLNKLPTYIHYVSSMMSKPKTVEVNPHNVFRYMKQGT